MTTETPFTTSDDKRRLETTVSFNADAPLTLSASNASGRVAVTTDASLPAGTIRVAATRADSNAFEDDDHHFNVRADGNDISIHPDWQFASGVSGLARRIRDQLQHGFRPEDWNLSRLKLSPELDFHIDVTLPASLAAGSQLKLRTASGEVDARAIAGNTSVVTASGDVSVRDLTGTVAVHTASGDVEASGITESLEINTASGDVTITGGDAWLAARSASGDVSIRGMRLRNSRITTVSGDISLEATFDNAAAGYGMETVSGDVTITATLPARAGATLGFGTLSGSSSAQGAWEKRKRREWNAGEGDDGPSINVKTVSGDLSASARLEATVEARHLDLPSRVPDPDDIEPIHDFKREMKEFGREMKHLSKEMQHTGHGLGHVIPPIPPVPPMPTHDERSARRAEERLREREERLREREQRLQEREEERQRHHDDRQDDRDERQRLRDLDRRLREEARGPDRTRLQPDAPRDTATAQPTEPVAPPARFTDEPDSQETVAVNIADTDSAPTEPGPNVSSERRDERLRILEALEKGEIDIEDALAQLDTEPTSGQGPAS